MVEEMSEEEAYEIATSPPRPSCGNCHFYQVCDNEKCTNKEPHGMCYVHPPRWVGPANDEESTTSRGVATWAEHPACRFHQGVRVQDITEAMRAFDALGGE